MDYGCRNLSPSFLVPLILGLWWEPEEEPAHLMEDRKERNREFMGERGREEGREGEEEEREKRGDTNGGEEMRRRDGECVWDKLQLLRDTSVAHVPADAFSCFDVIRPCQHTAHILEKHN